MAFIIISGIYVVDDGLNEVGSPIELHKEASGLSLCGAIK